MGLIGGCCLSFIAIFIPPLPVLIRTGCGGSLLINCILTLLGWIPGVFHAWYIILRYPDGKHRAREVRTYERRTSHSSHHHGGGHHGQHRHHDDRRHYGSGGGYYRAPPAAAQGMYYPQETGRTRY